jgi:hypothetical protein
MTRSVRIVTWIIFSLLIAALTVIGVLVFYYRPTFEWAR